jgi:putative flavoprotein involved in K+ transport
MSPDLDVLVIGAGQAGLALASALRGMPLRVELVDRAARLGDSWRRRYDSLTLFTPRALSALPGLPLPGDPDGYPTKDEIADYLESYARWLGVEVHLRTGIRRLTRSGGLFRAETDQDGVIAARAAVVAAGAFQEPIVPPHADELAPEVVQLTAATYRNPRQLPRGRVVVAGDGATGRQIALELAGDREVLLATGRRRVVTAQHILGRDQLWWAHRLGMLRASRESAVGRLVRRLDAFPGEHLRLRALRRRGIVVMPRLHGARGRSVRFADGTSADVATVVWAVGYRERTAWVDVPGAADWRGHFVERRGLSPVRRLYFIGREWQWSRGSALLAGVGYDASFLAGRIVAELLPAGCSGRAGVPRVATEPRA